MNAIRILALSTLAQAAVVVGIVYYFNYAKEHASPPVPTLAPATKQSPVDCKVDPLPAEWYWFCPKRKEIK